MNLVAHLVTNAHKCAMYVTMKMTASMEVMRLVAPLLNVLLMNICAHRVRNAIASRGNATVEPTATMEVTRLVAIEPGIGNWEDTRKTGKPEIRYNEIGCNKIRHIMSSITPDCGITHL